MPNRNLFSPGGPAGSAVSRLHSAAPPDQLVSPAASRRKSTAFVTPGSSGRPLTPSTMLNSDKVASNDDDQERRDRRRSTKLELQRRHINSPAAATPADRRKSMPQAVSNQQLADHYASCIKLSAENKITAKNAFGLHLIDYMSDLLRKKDMNNFQVASSTLDASAKIYAGRVDAIHSETYKVLTGLGRTGGGPAEAAEGGDDMEEGEAHGAADGDKKRKRARKGNPVEKNLKNINVPKLDIEFDVDPFVSKTSAMFDEGGTGGLMMNHLQLLDDTCELVLDSNTVMSSAHSLLPARPSASMVNLADFRSMYTGVNLEQLQICPSFVDFEFTRWNQDEASDSTLPSSSSQQQSEKRNEHAFDLEAEAEPVPSSSDMTALEGGGAEHFMDDFGNVGDDHEDVEAGGSGLDLSDVGTREEAQMVQHMMKNMKSGTIDSLMQILASEPSDYSYFNSKLLRTWAGPSHWKLKSGKSKSEAQFPGHLGGEKGKRTKKTKEPFVINYDENIDFDEYFKEKRAGTMLTKATLDKYSKTGTTLPEDLHYDVNQLFKLFIKAKIMLKKQKSGEITEDVEAGIGGYDYDNPNDTQGFCPGDVGDDDDDDVEGGMEFDLTADATSSQHPSSLDVTSMSGDKLVEQPKKVAQIDIGYAKAAKKMDIKRLKTSMWNILVKPEKKQETDKENASDTESVPTPGSDALIEEPHSFQKMVEVLPGKLSNTMANNLSVPIAFVCLLHLANEKCLSITSGPEMADLQILQG